MVHIVIPMGGKGERMRSYSAKPKPLIDVLDVPMIRMVLDHIHPEPDDHLYIIYHDQEDGTPVVASQDATTVGQGFASRIPCTAQCITRAALSEALTDRYAHVHLVALDRPTRGAAETVYRGLPALSEETVDTRVMLMDCDAFYTQDVVQQYRDWSAAHPDAAGAIFYKETDELDPIYSYLTLDATSGRIWDIQEKRRISRYANTGIYCFSRMSDLYAACETVVDATPDERSLVGGGRDIPKVHTSSECYLSCVVKHMLNQEGNPLYGIPYPAEFVFNLGTADLLSAYVDQTRLFLFDLDGTLVWSDPVYYSAWETLLLRYGIVLNPDLYQDTIMGNSDARVVETFSLATSVEEVSREKDRLFLERLGDLRIVAGAREFVRRAYLRGHRVGVVTNCNRAVAEAVLGHFGMLASVQCLVVGGECARAKPFPDPYLEAMRQLGGTPDRTIVFEDSKTGFMSAKAVTPRCLVGVETTYSASEILNHGADRSIPNYVGLDLEDIALRSASHTPVATLERNILESLVKEGVLPRSGGRVTVDPIRLKGGFIADVLSVTVQDLDEDGETLSCVLKLENETETFCSSMSRRLQLYEREYDFYRYYTSWVPVAVPLCYGIIQKDMGSPVGVLLKNLHDGNHVLALDLNVEPPSVALAVIRSIACLHARYWGQGDQLPGVKRHDDPEVFGFLPEFLDERLPQFFAKSGAGLTDEERSLIEQSVHGFTDVQQEMSQGKGLTFCHGDVKSANIFYKKLPEGGYEPVFLDWQHCVYGKGVQDLVFFLLESFDMDAARVDECTRAYYDALCEYGVDCHTYSYRECMADFYRAVFHIPLFVTIWFGSMDADELIVKEFPGVFLRKFLHFARMTQKPLLRI